MALALSVAIRALPGAAAEDLLVKGQTYESQGQWSLAAAVYLDLLEHEPGNATAYSRLGAVREKLGATDAALAAYREALRLDPEQSDARRALEGYYVSQGLAARRAGRSDAAIEAFRQAATFNPSSAIARLELGQELERLGRVEEAAKAYQEATALDPDDAAAHARLAAVYARQGLHERAIREFQEAVRRNPRDAVAHRGLGLALAAVGQRDQAIAALEQAIRFYMLVGDEDEARAVVQLEREIGAGRIPASKAAPPPTPIHTPARRDP